MILLIATVFVSSDAGVVDSWRYCGEATVVQGTSSKVKYDMKLSLIN